MLANTLQKGKSAERIAYSAVFVALTMVSAQIAIPIPPIPWTLQVFAVLLCGGLGGSGLGAISQLVYILIGIIGLPVFSGFTGGFQVILSPTFGYLLGFPVSAAICGLYSNNGGFFRRSPALFIVALLPIYIFGLLFIFFAAPFVLGKAINLKELAAIGIIPFIIPDLVKATLAWAVTRRLRRE